MTLLGSFIKSKLMKLFQKFKFPLVPWYFLNNLCLLCIATKPKAFRVTAADLKAVRGGESALAMAKRRYSTVLIIHSFRSQLALLQLPNLQSNA